FRSLAEQSPNMIFMNRKGKILYANKKCEEVTGYTREELYAPDFDFLTLVALESRDLVKRNFDKHLEGEEILPYEYILIDKNGERIDAINTSKLVQYDGMPAIIGIVTDITERKKAERALCEREATLMSIFRAAPIGIGLVSNRVLLQVNDKVCEMSGYSRDELIGQNARILYPSDEDYEYVGREKYGQINECGTGTVETKWKCKDGRIIDIILSSTVFEHSDFSKGVTFTALDITGRKQAEQRLLEHRAQLKSLASELSLAEERERRRVAIELHDRIGQSLVISKMRLQTLCKSLSSSQYAKPLKEVYDCLGQVIQDTRTLTFDLSYPILYEFGFKEAVAEWLEEQIQRKHGIETEFEDDGQPELLDEDVRVLLFRDVRELLINVVKHAKASKVKVSISGIDNDIQVCVEDNGVGFNADEIALLPTRDGGFGLFSIRERLERIDGLLEIESAPDKGSRITMTAPIKCESIVDGAQK
ncbi:MAG: PAS domain S-box protein, partial [Phycisphaerales bacterium]